MRKLLPLCIPLSALVLGCSSMSNLDERAKQEFERGNYPGAAASLDPVDPGAQGKDRLLFCMERGVIFHTVGRYDESNKYLSEAGDLSLSMQPIRTGQEVATFLGGEGAGEYKGEDYERLLIHAYVAMNYALMGRMEQAGAACRKIETEMERINQIRQQDWKSVQPGQDAESQKYYNAHEGLWQQRCAQYTHLNAFGEYLSGIVCEAIGQPDNALIYYKRVLALEPALPYLPDDLLRTSRAVSSEEYGKWKAQFKKDAPATDWKQMGEVVLLFQAGLAPIKIPAPDFPYVAASAIRPGPTQFAQVIVDGQPRDRTYPLNNIEAQAVITLQEQDAAVRVKTIVSLLVKHAAAEAIRRQNEVAGIFAHILADASQQPDLRSWRTLPRELQIARIPLAPGKYNLEVECVGSGLRMRVDNVVVQPGGHVFVTLRTVN